MRATKRAIACAGDKPAVRQVFATHMVAGLIHTQLSLIIRDLRRKSKLKIAKVIR
jgi:hypothetical protein